MQQLSVMQQQAGNEEAFEYNSLLRHGIFEAYSGILNGMSSAKCDQYLQPSAPVRLPDGFHLQYSEETAMQLPKAASQH